MNTQQAGVVAFHRAMGQPVGNRAKPLPADRIPVRVELIREEFFELLEALDWRGDQDTEGRYLFPANAKVDMVEMADACIDLLYVVKGLLVEAGIDDEVLFDEVQRSNMSKLGADGKPIIAGENDPDGIFPGRVKKGPNYFKPNLRGLLESGVADLDIAKVV